MIRAALSLAAQVALLLLTAVIGCFFVGWCLGWVRVGYCAVTLCQP